MKKHIKSLIQEFLGISNLQYRIELLEDMLLHEKSRIHGFAVLKRHLNRPDKPLPKFMGKDIEYD